MQPNRSSHFSNAELYPELYPGKQPAPGRDSSGRFAPGNSGGPGNPFARQVAGLRRALIDALTPDDFHAIAQKLLKLSLAGNIQAAKLLLAYTVGKPQPAPEPDHLDADEWQRFKETEPMIRELPAVVKTPEAELPINIVRSARPAMTRVAERGLCMGLRNPDLELDEIERMLRQGPRPKAGRNGHRRDKKAVCPTSPSANGVNGANGHGRGATAPPANGKTAPSVNGSNGRSL
jgi:hypothetical protein